MNFDSNLTDDAILEELGYRLSRRRLELELTQAELAKQAGIGKRTLERLESGGSSQMSNLIRVLRALGLIEQLDTFLPEASPRPMELLRRGSKVQKRASPKRRSTMIERSEPWTWGDES